MEEQNQELITDVYLLRYMNIFGYVFVILGSLFLISGIISLARASRETEIEL